MLLTQAMVDEAMTRVSQKKVTEFELKSDFFIRLQMLSELELAERLALLKMVDYDTYRDFFSYLWSWTTNNKEFIEHVLRIVPGWRFQDKVLSTAGFLVNHCNLIHLR